MSFQKSLNKLINQYKTAEFIKPGILFNDIIFPPNDKSIYSINPLYKNKTIEKSQSFLPIDQEFSKSQFTSLPKNIKYSWKSISQYISNYNIIKNKNVSLSNDDIIQGDIGNCYFFSGLKFLAEEPERILSLLNNTIENKNIKTNYFIINTYINGYKSKIIIDDKFPFIQNSQNEFAFCRYNTKTNNIWPMLLEKAWAKINSSYEDIIQGNIYDVFSFFTPSPIKLFHHDIKYNNLFETISKAIDQKFIVCTDMNTKSENLLLKKLGILSNHAYRVVGYETLLDSNGNKYNLIKIYNSYQITSWMGNWSPFSKKWTNEFKKYLNYDPNKEKNIYYMDINDYLKYYSTTYILCWHKLYSYYSKKIKINGINESFTGCKIIFNNLNINNSKNITYIIINTKNKRIQQNFKNKKNFENIFKNIVLYKIEEKGNWAQIDSICGKDERMSIEINNEQIKEDDEYIILISFPFLDKENENVFEIKKSFSINPNRPNNICVGVYTNICNHNILNSKENLENNDLNNDNNIIIEQINNNNERFEKNILKSIYEKSKLNSHLYYFDKERENESSRSINFENEKGAYGYLILDNRSNGILYERLSFYELENVNIFYVIKSLNKKKNSFNINNSSNREINEDLIDDKNTREIINHLKEEKYTNIFDNSKLSLLSSPKKNNKENNEKNPYELLAKVGAKSIFIIIFEKCDEYAFIDIKSQIAFKYPLYLVISEKRNNTINSNRLEYKYNKIEIYENIIEHSSGVIFYYMNKENKLKAKINISFKEIRNLELELTSDQLTNKNDIYIHKNNDNIILIELNLGTLSNKFFAFKTRNIFDNYNYTFEMNYSIFY